MTEFTELEKAVLAKILAGDHPVLAQLRRQMTTCRCSLREFTGVGFYTYIVAGDPDAPRPKCDLRSAEVVADIPGLLNGAGFILFVDDGYPVMLEGYTFGEPWPDRIDSFRVLESSREPVPDPGSAPAPSLVAKPG